MHNKKKLTLKLKDMGSFHIGGEKYSVTGEEEKEVIMTPGGEPVNFNPNETFHVGNMYVQYFIPQKISGKHPLFLWHGGGLTGSTFETTPDGRDGWLNYFIHKGWSVYNSDGVERGRSGWLPYHKAFADEPLLFPEYYPYEVWRMGEGEYKEGNCKLYDNSQFPIEYYPNLVKKLVPSWTGSNDLTMNAYMELVKSQESCIILAHSQGAAYAFQVAETYPDKVKAIVAIEPGIGGDIQNAWKIKGIPVLVLYGDNMQKSERWTKILNRTREYYNAVQDAGGTVEIIMLPDEGIVGNTHMMMMEKNNLEIAEIIQKWLEENGLYKA